MTKLEKDYALVVAENLRRLIYEKQVEQKDCPCEALRASTSGSTVARLKHIGDIRNPHQIRAQSLLERHHQRDKVRQGP
ncbi:MAG: hypothetical protein IKE94_08365 [Aeriscardovia sp.]|nr:hypothetical protein [Aeriscardovia sp.]